MLYLSQHLKTVRCFAVYKARRFASTKNSRPLKGLAVNKPVGYFFRRLICGR